MAKDVDASLLYEGTPGTTTARRRELWAGEKIRINFTEDLKTKLPYLKTVTHEVDLKASGVVLESVRGDLTPALKQPPRLNPSVSSGVHLVDGSFQLAESDLLIKGRGLDFQLARFYASRNLHDGPLGRNWDSPLFARLRSLPSGDVDYYDGTGRRDTFVYDKSLNLYISPAGLFSTLARALDGHYYLVSPDNTITIFDGNGRMEALWDRHVTTAHGTDGNRLLFLYDGADHLVAVKDDLGRTISLSYDETTMRLKSAKDFDGRVVTYTINEGGLTASGPDPASGNSKKPQRKTVFSTATADPVADPKAALYKSAQIEQMVDGEGNTPYEISYDAGEGGKVATLKAGGSPIAFTLEPDNRKATVADATTSLTVITHTEEGLPETIQLPSGGALNNDFGFSPLPNGTTRREGLLTAVGLPRGNAVNYGYQTGNPRQRRSQANLTMAESRPVGGLPGPTQTTTLAYGGLANSLASISGPGGTIAIARSETGDPVAVTDPAGTARYTFDKYGRVTSAIDPAGQGETRSYDETNGQIATLSKGGTSVSFATDRRGNVTGTLDGTGRSRSLVLNNLDQVEAVFEGDTATGGSSTTYRYDANGNISATGVLVSGGASPVTNLSSFEYDPLGRLLASSDSLTGRTGLGYDAAGNITAIDQGASHVGLGYDARQRLITITSPTSDLTRLGYDANSNLTTLTTPKGNTYVTAYDGNDLPTGTTDPEGNTRADTYDEAGHVVESKTINSSGNVVSAIGYVRDNAGRITKLRRKLFSTPYPANGPEPQGMTVLDRGLAYDAAGRITQTTDPQGRIATHEYDELGREKKRVDEAGHETLTEYDATGNAVKVTRRERRPDGGFDEFVTRTEYDGMGRPTKVTDPAGHITSYTYDNRGDLLTATDPDGGVTRYGYDAAGRKTKVVDPLGKETNLAYNAQGNLLTLTDANGNVTSYTYDAAGRLLTEVRPGGATWHFAYDAEGNQKQVTDPNGTVVDLVYDRASRLKRRVITKATNVEGPVADDFTVDALGRITAASSTVGPDSLTETFTYDSMGRQLEETLRIANGPPRTIRSLYDSSDALTQLTYPSGRVFALSYDSLGRLKEILRSTGASVVSYDDTRPTKKRYGNGLIETRAFDATPWLRTLAVSSGAPNNPVLGLDFGRNGRGLKTTIGRLERNVTDLFQYDAAGRMVKEQLAVPAAPAPQVPKVLTDYSLDALLNITKRDRTEGGTTVTTTASTNGRNQYTAFGADSLGYDANGNLTGWKGMGLRYDVGDRLAVVQKPDGSKLELFYDPFGRKVRETRTFDGSSTTFDYVSLGNQVLEVYGNDGTAPLKVFVYGREIDEVVQAELDPTSSGTTTTVYPLQDDVGNVLALTDADGLVLEKYIYEGYGKFRIFDPSGSPLSGSAFGWNRLFQGREYLPLLDAYDFRARTLWPELGRFGQEDPAGNSPRLSEYQALRGAWTAFVDPFGLYEEDVHHYLTRFLAEKSGFPRKIAASLGWETGKLDFDERDAMYGSYLGNFIKGDTFGNEENERLYHFVTPEHLDEMRESAQRMISWGFLGEETDRFRTAGEFLHAFEDSYSHQTDPIRKDPSKEYGRVAGHAAKGHKPDFTWERPAVAHQMAYDTFGEIKQLCQKWGGVKACGAMNWQSFAGTVMQFINYTPKLFGEKRGPLRFASPEDYTEKIQLLDPDYRLNGQEYAARRLKWIEAGSGAETR